MKRVRIPTVFLFTNQTISLYTITIPNCFSFNNNFHIATNHYNTDDQNNTSKSILLIPYE